jgi:hypothetical protein
MGQYPALVDGATFGADGAGVSCTSSYKPNGDDANGALAGTVVASSDPADPLIGARVFLTPMRGWEQDPDAPEGCAARAALFPSPVR